MPVDRCPKIYFNHEATVSRQSPAHLEDVISFHRSLPNYAPTPLIPVPTLAAELGLQAVFVKDESSRFELPSFKVLGASWGTIKALKQQLSLEAEVGVDEVSRRAREAHVTLFAATDGNHGRAVAFMAKLLGIQAHIYVSNILDTYTQRLIASEGAEVHIIEGDYDAAIEGAAHNAHVTEGGLLIQDMAFDSYTQIPRWIVEGYSTMLQETHNQLSDFGLTNTHVVCPVGVGSLAHAVSNYYRSSSNPLVKLMVVEPDTSACLHHSLKAGHPVSIETSSTIMDGMNCGTLSKGVWEDVKDHVAASVTLTDLESHREVEYLRSLSIQSGPCGAATVAGLRRICASTERPSSLNGDSVVVLLGTEGSRPYQTPAQAMKLP